jgi:hypothetical protein
VPARVAISKASPLSTISLPRTATLIVWPSCLSNAQRLRNLVYENPKCSGKRLDNACTSKDTGALMRKRPRHMRQSSDLQRQRSLPGFSVKPTRPQRIGSLPDEMAYHAPPFIRFITFRS